MHDSTFCLVVFIYTWSTFFFPAEVIVLLAFVLSPAGVHFSKALFVPSLSTYHRVDSGASIVTSDPSTDVSWQLTLQRTWEKLVDGKGVISICVYFIVWDAGYFAF